jgi:hypothetical protein
MNNKYLIGGALLVLAYYLYSKKNAVKIEALAANDVAKDPLPAVIASINNSPTATTILPDAIQPPTPVVIAPIPTDILIQPVRIPVEKIALMKAAGNVIPMVQI